MDMITENVKDINDIDGQFNTNRMWKLKRKVLNRGSEPISAKKDVDGKMVTNPDLLKTLYLDTYVDRLRNREMNPKLQ